MTKDVEAASGSWLKRIVIGRDPKRTMARLVLWVALCLLVPKFVLLPIRVQGISMLPTYHERSVNFINRLAYVRHEPQRGDVVGIKLAGQSVMYMKRIVALPGETIEFRDGRILINGELLDEPYLKFPCNWQHPPEKLELGEYYVVGDNRSMDFFEHTQGKAWREQIVGKVLR